MDTEGSGKFAAWALGEGLCLKSQDHRGLGKPGYQGS